VGEELVQDTFMKTWAYLVKGGKIGLMKAFLYHILNNLIVDEYRKKKYKTESLDLLLEKGFEPRDENSLGLVDFLDGKAAMNKISKLPKNYKKVMYMRFVKNMSLADISLETGQTKNSVSVKIHRGLQKLRVLYGRGSLIIK
jgi:RNA polymerase sigma-70 factor (ECF subfamily)